MKGTAKLIRADRFETCLVGEAEHRRKLIVFQIERSVFFLTFTPSFAIKGEIKWILHETVESLASCDGTFEVLSNLCGIPAKPSFRLPELGHRRP